MQNRRIDQLVMLAKALANEIETLKTDLTKDEIGNKQIDFYGEVERYEIELIRSALNQCDGNQARAAKLLHLKSTTLNATVSYTHLKLPTTSRV